MSIKGEIGGLEGQIERGPHLSNPLGSHIKRIVTGVVLIIAVLLILMSEYKWPFTLAVISISQLCLYEYLALKSNLSQTVRVCMHIICFFTLGLFILKQWIFLPVVLFLPIIFIAFWILKQRRILVEDLENISFALLGCLYITLPFALLITLELLPNGKLWIMFLIAVVAAGDISAYYVGKGFGRIPLSKEISPKKTLEGAIGSTVGSLLAGMLFLNASKIQRIDLIVILLTFLISVMSQAGDLFESWLKRVHQKKDSGNILPGHGGILDRVDGLIFGIPPLYCFLSLKYT